MRYEESLAQLKEILSKEFTFRNATDDELARLNELAGGRLTDEMLAFYQAFGLDGDERALYGNTYKRKQRKNWSSDSCRADSISRSKTVC